MQEVLGVEQLKKIVTFYVNEHKNKILPKQVEGHKYYRTENPDIMGRKKLYYSNKSHMPKEDPYKANNRVASSYVKLLVDQKIDYSINDRMGISVETGDDKPIRDALGFKAYKRILRKVAKDACNKIYGVVQFYVNPVTQKLDYKYIPSEQVIRVPNADDNDIVDAVIRYYVIDVTDNSGKEKTVTIAEYWDAVNVWYFYKEEDGEGFVLAPQYLYPNNPTPHMSERSYAGDVELESKPIAWGMPPFAFLFNNDESQRDLDPILPIIKVWDIVMSDFANNLEDFQDVFWILKGYGGQDIEEFFEEVKRLKVIKTDGDGSASTQTIEVPTEARERMLDRLEKALFKFGRGVNVDDIQGDITNVRIYSMYSGLDLKANEFEMEINNFFDQTLVLLNRYLAVSNKPLINAEAADLKFKRSMILNKAEVITSLLSEVGFRSTRTLLEQHPDVDDVDEELKRLDDEAKALEKRLGGDLDFEDDDKPEDKTKGAGK